MTFCSLGENCVVYDRMTCAPGYSGHHCLCPGCTEASKSDLNLLRYDYVDLSQLIPLPDVRGEAGRIFRPKPESKAPIDVSVFTLRGDVAWFVRQAAEVLRWHSGTRLANPMPVREGYQLDTDVRYLIPRVDNLAGLPKFKIHWLPEDEERSELDGVELVLHIRRLHKRARKVCGTLPRLITVPGDCGPCGTPSLRRNSDDAAKIWCTHCKNTLTRDEYENRLRLHFPTGA